MKRIAIFLLALTALHACKKEELDTITDSPSLHEVTGRKGIKNNNLFRTKSQDYVFVGYSDTEYYLTKVGRDGTEIWSKPFSYDGTLSAPAIAEAKNGDIFLAGTVLANGALESSIVVIKTNDHGKEQWRKVLDGHPNEAIIAARITQDDDLMVVGYQELTGTNHGTHVIRLDEDGEIEKEFDGPDWWPLEAWVNAQNHLLLAGEVGGSEAPKWILYSLGGGLIEMHEAFVNDQHRCEAAYLDEDGKLCFVDYSSFGGGYNTNWAVCNQDGSAANNHVAQNIGWPLNTNALAKGNNGEKYLLGWVGTSGTDEQFIASLKGDFTLDRIVYFPSTSYVLHCSMTVEPNGNILVSMEGEQNQSFLRLNADLDFLL